MRGKDVAVISRLALDDRGSVKKWDDEEFVPLINQAVKEIVRMWPDSLIDTDGAFITVVEIETITGTVSITDYWKQNISDFVVARAYEMKGGGKENRERAKWHDKNFLKRG
jgi:hypothetical protein